MSVYCNGHRASADDLAGALVNYGHFTSLQVRGGAVQGLDLHLRRLRQGTEELFGSTLDGTRVQA
ncbi:MAG TPA: aminotransferase, partial [Stenotrophomonas sp.]|nr:aminotransferase [Stenotrophomonas sp.]